MVITNGVERAVQYYHTIRDYLEERKSPHRAVVAFSGEHEFGGDKMRPKPASTASHQGRLRRRSRKIPTAFC